MSRLALLGFVHLGLDLLNSEPVHQLDGFSRLGRILFRSRRLADVYLAPRLTKSFHLLKE